MERFYVWLGVVAALCLGVMALAIFFTLLNAIKRRFEKTVTIKIKGILDSSRAVNVCLNSGKTVSDIRFVGVLDVSSAKGIPYFANMVVFETADGRQVLLRPESIRMIEEIQPAALAQNT